MRKPAAVALLTAVLLLAGLAAPAPAQTPVAVPTDVRLLPCSTPSQVCGSLFWNHPMPAEVTGGFFMFIVRQDNGDRFTAGQPASVARDYARDNGGHAEFGSALVVVPDVVYEFSVLACGGTFVTPTDCSAESVAYEFMGTFIGDGFAVSVDGDSPGEALERIRDYGLEHAPVIVALIGAIFLVGLLFHLVRRGLVKSRSAMHL